MPSGKTYTKNSYAGAITVPYDLANQSDPSLHKFVAGRKYRVRVEETESTYALDWDVEDIESPEI